MNVDHRDGTDIKSINSIQHRVGTDMKATRYEIDRFIDMTKNPTSRIGILKRQQHLFVQQQQMLEDESFPEASLPSQKSVLTQDLTKAFTKELKTVVCSKNSVFVC